MLLIAMRAASSEAQRSARAQTDELAFAPIGHQPEPVVASVDRILSMAYRLAPEVVWRISSLVFLAIIWAGWLYAYMTSSSNSGVAARAREASNLTVILWLALEVAIDVPLLLVVLGFFTPYAGALYTTAVIAALFQAAVSLAQLVLRPLAMASSRE